MASKRYELMKIFWRIHLKLRLWSSGRIGSTRLGFVIDKQELIDYIGSHPDIFPPDKFNEYMAKVEPEQIAEFVELLYQRGHNERIISGILGGNFLRVAEQTWK